MKSATKSQKKAASPGVGTGNIVKMVVGGVLIVVVLLGLWKGKQSIDMMRLHGKWTGEGGGEISLATIGDKHLRLIYYTSDFGTGVGNYEMRCGVGGIPLYFQGSMSVQQAPYLLSGQTATIDRMSLGGFGGNEDKTVVEFTDVKVSHVKGGKIQIVTGDSGILTISKTFTDDDKKETMFEFSGSVKGGVKLMCKHVAKGEIKVEGSIEGTYKKKNAF